MESQLDERPPLQQQVLDESESDSSSHHQPHQHSQLQQQQQQQPLSHFVFVYGTLKRHQPNNHFFESGDLGQCRLVGTARSEKSFPLIVTTRWKLPFLLYSPGNGQNINGEVYRVDDRLLAWTDKFEGHPEVYEREQIPVRYLTVEQDSAVKLLPGDSEVDTAEIPEQEGDSVEEERTWPAIGETEMCWVYFLKRFPPGLLNLDTVSSYDARIAEFQPNKEFGEPRDIRDIEEALQQECQRTVETRRGD